MNRRAGASGIVHRVFRSVYRHAVHFVSANRDAFAVLGLALGLRVAFSLLLANTFDKDEFVYLALGRAVGHGAMPYRDFAFFHPPGILVLVGALNWLTGWWWPAARIVDLLLDSITAVLVWRMGLRLYDARTARMAGILYAANPIVLVSAVRVDQESIITLLSVAGLALLLSTRKPLSAALAGVCLAVACWVKYPAIVFLPVYVLLAPRRAWAIVLGAVGAVAVLFLPYLGDARQLWYDTVTWQLVHRYHTPFVTRVEVTAVFWLAMSPFAVLRLMRKPAAFWLVLGFATGCVFIATSSAYPHYFVPVAPYGALLGAPVATRILRVPKTVAVAFCLLMVTLWAAFIQRPAPMPIIPASTFSAIEPVIQDIDQTTSPRAAVLADRLEYSYLAQRAPGALYFWDQHDVVTAQVLLQRLRPGDIVVLYPRGDQTSFPAGFISILNGRYPRVQTSSVTIWSGDEVADRLAVVAND